MAEIGQMCTHVYPLETQIIVPIAAIVTSNRWGSHQTALSFRHNDVVDFGTPDRADYVPSHLIPVEVDNA